jgi:hypothetical protein
MPWRAATECGRPEEAIKHTARKKHETPSSILVLILRTGTRDSSSLSTSLEGGT